MTGVQTCALPICVCAPLGFVTKEFCDLQHVNELKNFVANIFLKLVCKSCIRIHAYSALKGENVTTEQVQLGIGVRVQV